MNLGTWISPFNTMVKPYMIASSSWMKINSTTLGSHYQKRAALTYFAGLSWDKVYLPSEGELWKIASILNQIVPLNLRVLNVSKLLGGC